MDGYFFGAYNIIVLLLEYLKPTIVRLDFMSTRRTFLKCALCTVATACVPEAKYGGPTSTLDDSANTEDDDIFCDTLPNTSWAMISLDDHPELNTVGGYAYASVNGKSLIVAHVMSDCFVSLDQACTHEGEIIQYQSAAQRFVCPRHAATFSPMGEVLGGPAPIELGYYPTARQGRELWIQV